MNFKVEDKTFEIGVKTRSIENGVKGRDSLYQNYLWDKKLMAESLASARGGISHDEPESLISQQSHQPSFGTLQLDQELSKYLNITITEKTPFAHLLLEINSSSSNKSSGVKRDLNEKA